MPARYDRKRFEELRAQRGPPLYETLGTSGFGRLADIPRGVGNRMSQPGMEFMKERNRNDRRARMQARLEEIGGMAPGSEGEGAPAGGAQALLDQMPEPGTPAEAPALPRPSPASPPPPAPGPPPDWQERRQQITEGGLGPMPGAPPGAGGGVDFETLIAQTGRDRELGKAKAMQSITEGLNLAGRSIAGLSGAQIPDLDDRDPAARAEVDRLEGLLTPNEVRSLQAQGLHVDKNTRRSSVSMLQQGMQSMSRQGAARTATEERRAKEETRVKELGETRTAATDKELRGRISTERDKHFVGKNSTVGKYDAAIQTSERALEIFNEGGPQAFQGGLTMLLKGGFGEAGNIGQKERQQLAAANLGLKGALDWLERGLFGDYTDEQYQGAINLTKILLDRHRRDKQTFVEDTVDSFMSSQPKLLEGLSREDIAARLGAGLERSAKALEDTVTFIVPGTGPESGPADVPLSDIEQFMIDYPDAERQEKQ